MALSQAEKQRRYRERQLGYHPGKYGLECRKKRIQCLVPFTTWCKLGRLASYHGCTMTKLIEDLVANAEKTVIGQIAGTDVDAYLREKLQRNRTHPEVYSRP